MLFKPVPLGIGVNMVNTVKAGQLGLKLICSTAESRHLNIETRPESILSLFYMYGNLVKNPKSKVQINHTNNKRGQGGI